MNLHVTEEYLRYIHLWKTGQLKKKTMYVTYKHCLESFCKKILRKNSSSEHLGNQAGRVEKLSPIQKYCLSQIK